MATSTIMKQLPLDVLECIVAYLSDEDLSRCCTVSKSWREVFSDNMFWRKRCNIKLSDYLESAKCLVEPFFTTPCVQDSSLMPLSGWRLSFLREQHYLRNLRSGRYKREEIEFDFGNMVNCNVKVEFVGNDYMFLHSWCGTQVWNVAQKPNLVMNIPFRLYELWEPNLYHFHDNKLIVVQCNIVHMFNICLGSKTWSYHHSFFFDKPEGLSLKITKDSHGNDLFKHECNDLRHYTERVICGNFLIGITATKVALQNPVLHIWDLNSSKMIKEENCLERFGSDISGISFGASSTSQDKIIIICERFQMKCFAVYSLANLMFLASYHCNSIKGDSLLLDGYLFIYDNLNYTILRYDLVTNIVENVKYNKGNLFCLNVFCNKILANSYTDLIFINPSSKIVEVQPCSDIQLRSFKVVKDKYVALCDRKEHLTQIWGYRADYSVNRVKQKAFTKLFSLPPDSGSYRTANEVCSKIVLEREQKCIVLNFW